MFSRIFKFSVFRSLVFQEGEVFFRNIVTFNNDNLRLDSARKKISKNKKRKGTKEKTFVTHQHLFLAGRER